MQHASLINVSYQTLKNISSRCACVTLALPFLFMPPPLLLLLLPPPLLLLLLLLTCCRRAIHLLQLLGHPLTENDRLTDLEFLSDVMEVQEDVTTCDIAALRAHAQRNSDWIQQQRALASQAFASGRISDAKAIVIKLQYAPLASLARASRGRVSLA